MPGVEIERLIQLLSRLPGLGNRSARRAALYLVEKREAVLLPLAKALADTAEAVRVCPTCGNFDSCSPCSICTDPTRDPSQLCVVEDVGALWALERGGAFRGRYHVLGGLLSALDGLGPEDLNVASLITRAAAAETTEIILATPATVEGQTTAHYIADRLAPLGITLSGLARGVPVGGSLDYLDDGTISAALASRRTLIP